MPWGIWLSVLLKKKKKIIPWKWSKGWDCFSSCSGLWSHPVTVPSHPLSQPHHSPLTPTPPPPSIAQAATAHWDLCPLFSLCCFATASPLLPLSHSHMCSQAPTNRAQVFLPRPERGDTATCLFSKPQRQQKLNRPWGWRETGPSQGHEKCLSSEPAEFRQKKNKQKKSQPNQRAPVCITCLRPKPRDRGEQQTLQKKWRANLGRHLCKISLLQSLSLECYHKER